MAGLNFGLYNAALAGQRAGTQSHLDFLRSTDAINRREQQINQQQAFTGLDPYRNEDVTTSLGDLAPPPVPGGFAPRAPAPVSAPQQFAQPGSAVGSPSTAATATPAFTPTNPPGAGVAPQQASRAGLTGAPGVTQINPQASQFMQDVQYMLANSDVNGVVNRIGDGLAVGKVGPAGNLVGDIWGYFTDTPDTAAQRTRAQKAMKWYRSPKAKSFFRSNPEALRSAVSDPLGVYEQIQSAGLSVAGTKGNRQFTPQESIKQAAAQLQLDPNELAAVLSFETAGTFNPWQKGPVTQYGEHRGLIQWGETQRKEFGVTKNMSFSDQMAKVVEYALARGYKPGEMGLMEFYSTVNAGQPGLNTASDVKAGGTKSMPTVADKVNSPKGILGEHLANAKRFMQDGTAPTVPTTPKAQAARARIKTPKWIEKTLSEGKSPAQLSQDYQQLNKVRNSRRNAVQAQLNTLARRAADHEDRVEIARRTGDANLMSRYMTSRDTLLSEIKIAKAKFQEADLQYVQRMGKLQTDDALLRLSFGDPTMAAEIYRQNGIPLQFEMRADGKVNIWISGGPDRVQLYGVASVDEIGRMVREDSDERYRDIAAASDAARSSAEFKSQLKMLEKQAEQIGLMAIEKIKGQFDLAKEMKGYQKAILDPNGTSIIMMADDGSHALRYTPDKVTEGSDGEDLYSNAIDVVRGPAVQALKSAGLRVE